MTDEKPSSKFCVSAEGLIVERHDEHAQASTEPVLDAEQEQLVRETLEAHPLLTREKAIRILREFGF